MLNVISVAQLILSTVSGRNIMNIRSSKKGWIVTKNGKPINTPDITKKGLLIGYNLMLLRGLRNAEKDLRTPPYNIRRVVLKYEENSKLYGAAVNGRISLELSAFSNLEISIERTKMSTAFAISCSKKYDISEEESRTLSSFYYIWRDKKNVRLPKDKRKKKQLINLRLKTERIFEKIKIVIVPVKYVLVS